eukprot:1158705-Pelagomonas_calceolata.AAC.22
MEKRKWNHSLAFYHQTPMMSATEPGAAMQLILDVSAMHLISTRSAIHSILGLKPAEGFQQTDLCAKY